METRKMWAILVFVLVSMANGAQYLTIDGNAVDSITLEVGQVCTVEVASTDNSSYADNVGFDNALVLGTFSHVQTKPAAGNRAAVEEVEYSDPDFYGYNVMAGGLSPRPSAGVHFVFEYEAQEIGETALKLYNESFTSVVDSVHIKIIPAPMGTAFTYQGHLTDSNKPADGYYDLQFNLYNTGVGGTPKGSAIVMNEADVNDGLFTINLDFGRDVFDGNALWLEIGVRSGELNDPNAYTLLSPRQRVMPVPYAIYAQRAGSLERGVSWGEISSRPPGLDDGDQTGITSETDPTVNLGKLRSLVANDFHNLGGSELDPVYLGSSASGITSGNITNWNTGFGWGNHALAGYLKTETDPTVNLGKLRSLVANDFHSLGGSELDPVYSGSSASGITSGNITNWNTAFGWGNHGLVGYLKTETDPTVNLGKLKSLVSNDFHNLGGTDQVGITSESDPQVGSNSANYVPKWDGSALISGTVYDNGNIGIGTTTPAEKLTVEGGTIKATNSLSTGMAVYGEATDNTGTAYGGYFKSNFNAGVGVYARGFHGVYAVSGASSGKAVYGEAFAAIGQPYGGYFKSLGISGVAVYGEAPNTGVGTNYGGWFQAGGSSGKGVYGLANNSGNYQNFGGWFEAAGTDGKGVYGLATGSNGRAVEGYASNSGNYTNYGGYFEAKGSTGRAVYGEATDNTGTAYGGYFKSNFNAGVGVYARGFHGVYAVSGASSGKAVYGEAYAVIGQPYGGYFKSLGISGVAVYGEAPNTGTGTNYGGYFMAAGSNGRGVVGVASASGGVSNIGGDFVAEGDSGIGVKGSASGSSGIGVRGMGQLWDFFAVNGRYGNLSSIRFKRDVREIDEPLGKITRLRGVYFNWDEEHGGYHDVGMIAEEVGQVLPEIVRYEENGVAAMGMDYSKLTPLLVEAVKALKAEVDSQQKKITALEAALAQNEFLKQRIEILEGKIQASQPPLANEVQQ